MPQAHFQSSEFSDWVHLAQNDPQRFEALRQKAIESCINQAPRQCRERLKGLQWRVDIIRQRSANPMAACIKISNLMWESLLGDNGLLQRLEGGLDTLPSNESSNTHEARIIPFRRRGQD